MNIWQKKDRDHESDLENLYGIDDQPVHCSKCGQPLSEHEYLLNEVGKLPLILGNICNPIDVKRAEEDQKKEE